MYVCILCKKFCVHVFMYAYIFLCRCICRYACMYICIYVYSCVNNYTFDIMVVNKLFFKKNTICFFVCMWVREYVCMHVYTYRCKIDTTIDLQ